MLQIRKTSASPRCQMIPSFMKIGALESRGGSMFQKKRTRDPVRGEQGPVRNVADSSIIKFPLYEKAHLPLRGVESAKFVSRSEHNCLRGFRLKRIGTLKIKPRQFKQEAKIWRSSLTGAQWGPKEN